mgnify:CR=1 FL=1
MNEELLVRLRVRLLTTLLSDSKYGWRSLRKLATAIEAPEVETKELLLDIGARRNLGEKNVWKFAER